jgi:hypothetical protein
MLPSVSNQQETSSNLGVYATVGSGLGKTVGGTGVIVAVEINAGNICVEIGANGWLTTGAAKVSKLSRNKKNNPLNAQIPRNKTAEKEIISARLLFFLGGVFFLSFRWGFSAASGIEADFLNCSASKAEEEESGVTVSASEIKGF